MEKIKILTLTDVLEVLHDFDLRHYSKLIDMERELEGCVIPAGHLIQISDNNVHAERIYTIIHELIHGNDILKGFRTTERYTDMRTNATFRRLYGHHYGA